jgi:septum site-determining protein MinC
VEVVEKTTVKWDIQIQPWSFVTLTLFSNDVQELAVHLQKKLAQAPNFFKKTPLILAFDEEQEEIEISTLQTVLSILERYQLHLSGCSGPVHWVSSIADFFNIPYLMNEKNSEIKHKKDSQVLTEPLRAGQQFYTQDDVIILARTHSGSEVISQGHIHCYSKAQGRLIAGVNGQKESKIFCQSLDAELLSIAGVFMTKRQIDENYLGKQCIIELKDGQLNIQLIEKELT